MVYNKILSSRFLLTSLLAFFGLFASHAAVVLTDDVQGTVGDETDFSINLQNGDMEVVAWQMDVLLPAEVSLSADFALTSRAQGHVLTANKIGDAWRLVCYSSTNKTFKDAAGAILTASLLLAQPGQGQIKISNIKLTDKDLAEHALADCTAAVSVAPGFVLGDVNGDGEISVPDVTMTVDFALGNNPAGGVREAADMNQDGEISVPDVTLIVNRILTGQTSASRAPKAIDADGGKKKAKE